MNLKSMLLFVAATVAVLLAFRYGLRSVSQDPPRKPQPDPAEWATWKEERFEDLGFSIRHAPDYATAVGGPTAEKAGPFLTMKSEPRLAVMIPKTRFKGSNFIEGFVTVVAGDTTGGDEAACNLLARGGGGASPMLKREEYGRTSFATGGVSGQTGTTMTESLVYHAWYRGRCIELTATLISTNPRSVPKAKQFDRVLVWKLITDMVRTFKQLPAGR